MATTPLSAWDNVPSANGDDSSTLWRVIKWHLKYWVTPVIGTLALYMFAIGLAKSYGLNGNLMGVGLVMLVTMVIILIIGYALGLVGIHYAYHFWRGQVGAEEEGKERGFSWADGFREMEKHKSSHKDFVHAITGYAAIPFLAIMALSWLSPALLAKYGPALLVLSFPAVILVTWLNPGKFVARLTQFLVISAIVVIIGLAVWDGIKIKLEESKEAAAKSAPANTKAATQAATAKTGYLQEEARKCFEGLATAWTTKQPPTPEAEAECQRKQAAAEKEAGGSSTIIDAIKSKLPSSAAGGGATSSTATAAMATAAGALNSFGRTTTDPVGKRIQYAPHQVTGAISLGDYAAGNYRIMGEGKRYQRFGSANWEMDAFGRVTAEGGNTYSAPSSAPLAGPNGMLVARSGGQVHKVDSCFRHPGGRIHGDLNVAPGDYVGSGSIEVWVEGC